MKLRNMKIAVVTHEYFKGSGQELRDYLINKKIDTQYYVAHKFVYVENSVSYLRTYKDGKEQSYVESPKILKNEYLHYLKDAYYNLRFFMFSKEKFDLYVGVDSFNAIFGIFLRWINKVDKVAFFTIDYVMENRFNNNLLNKLYVWMDRKAFFGSDYTLNVSEEMSKQRIRELGDIAKKQTQLEVPIGIPQSAKKLKVDKKDNVIVYAGSINPESGVEIMIKAAPKLIHAFPNIEIRIIGLGPEEEKIRLLVKELGVERNVNFLGFIDSNKEQEKLLRYIKQSTLGIAMYPITEDSYKRFSDVTKPKDYMSCGLPVITTSLIPIAERIKQYNLGRVVEYDENGFANAVIDLLNNKEELNQIEKNVYKFSEDMTWENIYNRMFEQMNITP